MDLLDGADPQGLQWLTTSKCELYVGLYTELGRFQMKADPAGIFV